MLADERDELLGEVFRESLFSASAVIKAAACADCFRSVSEDPGAFVLSEVKPGRLSLSWHDFFTLIPGARLV